MVLPANHLQPQAISQRLSVSNIFSMFYVVNSSKLHCRVFRRYMTARYMIMTKFEILGALSCIAETLGAAWVLRG